MAPLREFLAVEKSIQKLKIRDRCASCPRLHPESVFRPCFGCEICTLWSAEPLCVFAHVYPKSFLTACPRAVAGQMELENPGTLTSVTTASNSLD